ncbi:hypothetical protein [Actinobacillus equuli]|uniref:hypothetical protein n=1 Tax=Actinobacillus equuli TaxID=718 RepID=UPI002441E81D|nr:hypothetical protein [Actinobacillus equuli]WGE58879.1 hypothetical protein NYR73_09345 [Actinobacillus equuli subsp. haemolyticus]WGE60521.1 hypothetical protein NYR74_07335 [Actinobacillus equuli subsp. haemolyticus]
MKKLSIALLTISMLTGCTQIQNSVERLPDNSVLKHLVQLTSKIGNSVSGIPANVTQKQFTDSLIKQLYPQAIYDNDWQVEDILIQHTLKDIRTEEGEKRYVAIYQPKMNSHLFIFDKQSDTWVLEQKMNDELDLAPSEIKIVSLGKSSLGFQVKINDGGTSGEDSSIYWIYNVGNALNKISGCESSSSRSTTINFECKPKIRSDIKSANGFYPIELSYVLDKVHIIESPIGDNVPKGYSWAGGYASKELGSRKGKVLIEFNTSKQTYMLPTSFEKALSSNNADSLWNYFNK